MHTVGENFVYIMTNKGKQVLYTGVSSDLRKRVLEHKNKTSPDSFTARYKVNILVYAERYPSITEAILREKQIKAGTRAKKISLIESMNPEWKDLSEGW